jgi:enoyl-CoA hydratase/carnithine racemase
MIETTRSGDVFILTMVAGENRFNPTMLDAFTRALDEVEASEGPAAVVLTGQDKFFSNGLDLDWMMANAEDGGPTLVVNGLQALYSRLIAFPTITVAAINGHSFAGGGMLALACDQRVMRDDRGFFCLPEVDINIPFSEGMSKLVRSKLSKLTSAEAMLTGRRYGAAEALAAGIVDQTAAEDQVVAAAIERAAAHAGKNRGTLQAIKKTIYAEAIESLGETISFG